MENNEQYIIEMNHIRKEFPGIVANDDITLNLKKGEVHALLGENGAGKSTLMSILFGLYEPDVGEIKLNGKPIKIKDPNDATKFRIGMVHQHFMLVDIFTGLENIILGYEDTKFGFVKKSNTRKKLEEIQKTYNLSVDLDKRVDEMTVGQQQRIEILKMLYRDNEILIFDEPTAVLTPDEIKGLMKIIKALQVEGKTILFISHKLKEVLEVSNRITILRKGKCVGTFNTAKVNEQQLASLMVGRNVNFNVDKEDKIPGDVVLNVNNLVVKNPFNKKVAVNNVSFDVRKGEIVALLGIDGNGQDELVEAITGLIKTTSGNINLNGVDITKYPIIKRNKTGISHIPADRHKYGLVLDYNLMYNLILETYKDKVEKDVKTKISEIKKEYLIKVKEVKNKYDDLLKNVSSKEDKVNFLNQKKEELASIKNEYNSKIDEINPKTRGFSRYGFLTKKTIKNYADILIEKYDIRSSLGAKTIVRSMSGGNQQKVIVAREIDRDEDLLIAVQPTRGLDIGAIENIHSQIVKERSKDKAVLLVSLELDEVFDLADRILVIYEGQIVGEFKPNEITYDEIGLYMSGAKSQLGNKGGNLNE